MLPHVGDLKKVRLEAWLVEMRGKLAVDGIAIGGAAAQFFYVYSRLSEFKEQFLPYVSTVMVYDGQPEELLERVRRALEEPHKRRRAAINVVTMRQGRQENVTTFLARHDVASYQGGATQFKEDIAAYLETEDRNSLLIAMSVRMLRWRTLALCQHIPDASGGKTNKLVSTSSLEHQIGVRMGVEHLGQICK